LRSIPYGTYGTLQEPFVGRVSDSPHVVLYEKNKIMDSGHR